VRPPDDISIPEWIQKNVRLSEKMAAEPGLLRISRTPYTKGPLRALENIFVETIILVWGRQLGKTMGVLCPYISYVIAQDPGPATFLLPTRDKAKEYFETKLDPIFQACEEIRKRIPDNPDDYTKLRMNFVTMVLAMAWAGSESQTTTRSNRYLIVDEADEIKKAVGEHAIDPIKGIEQTTTTFSNRKEILASSPTAPEGNIWQALKSCRYVFEYWIPCPHCGVIQILYWENVRFGDDHDPVVVEEIAWYECEACQGKISNMDKIRMLTKGEWRARLIPDPCEQIMKNIRAKTEETIPLDDVLSDRRVKKIGFHLPKWYSPFSGGTFGIIAKDFLEANQKLEGGQDFAPMRNWRMYNAARPWEEVVFSETELELMKNKINLAPLICPKDTVALTCGIDPGQGGFWFSIIAWKPDMSSHLVHYGWLAGDYDTSELEKLVSHWTYRIDGEDRQFMIWRIGIDTGGGQYETVDTTMTAAAYDFIRRMKRPGLIGTKGMSHASTHRVKESRIEKMPGDKGRVIPGGVILLEINTDMMKDALWFHLSRNNYECPKCHTMNKFKTLEILSGESLSCGKCQVEFRKRTISGLFTFHNQTDEEYLNHLLAEEKRIQKDGKSAWIRKKQANHLLDATVIAFALADPEYHGGVKVILRDQGDRRRQISKGVV